MKEGQLSVVWLELYYSGWSWRSSYILRRCVGEEMLNPWNGTFQRRSPLQRTMQLRRSSAMCQGR